MFRMEASKWTTNNCHLIFTLVSISCAVFFQDVTCQVQHGRGDNSISHTPVKGPETHKPTIPKMSGKADTTEFAPLEPRNQLAHRATEVPSVKHDVTHNTQVVCVNEATVRNKNAVRLKLKNTSTCMNNQANILSVFEHLCDNDTKLEIYKQDDTEMILSGKCIEDDPKGMTEKFNNDNIRDKVGVLKAETVWVNQSRPVLISVLLTGLLVATLLIAAYILKTNCRQVKGKRLEEEMFQVDEPNQGNTLLSVAPLPPQEPEEKPISNGESQDSPPTNGYSATQTSEADTEM